MNDQSSLSRFKSSLLDWSDVPLRLILAATFIVHGYSKLYGGVDGFAGMLGQMGVPAPVLSAWLVTMVEFVGGFFLLAGFLTRLTALAIGINMIMAIALVHIGQGFMMKAGPSGPAGYEWQLALLAMCVTLVMRGAGSLSIDHMLRSSRQRARRIEAATTQARTGSATATGTATTPAAEERPAPERPRIPRP
jgi:putative oxidoreductase